MMDILLPLYLDHQTIANRMQELTDKGREGFGNPVLVDDFLRLPLKIPGTIAVLI